jgi:hypothetical protein
VAVGEHAHDRFSKEQVQLQPNMQHVHNTADPTKIVFMELKIKKKKKEMERQAYLRSWTKLSSKTFMRRVLRSWQRLRYPRRKGRSTGMKSP